MSSYLAECPRFRYIDRGRRILFIQAWAYPSICQKEGEWMGHGAYVESVAGTS